MAKKEKKEKIKQTLLCNIMFLASIFVSLICLIAVVMSFFLDPKLAVYMMVGGLAVALLCWLGWNSMRKKPEVQPVKIQFNYDAEPSKKKEDDKKGKKQEKEQTDFKDAKTIDDEPETVSGSSSKAEQKQEESDFAQTPNLDEEENG